MSLKPCVLNEYLKELSLFEDSKIESDLKAPIQTYCSHSDNLYLEDEHVRVCIKSSTYCEKLIPVDFLVTGLVIGCLGGLNSSGEFEVLDWCLPGAPLVRTSDNSLSSKNTHNKALIGFVSGLSIGGRDANYKALMNFRNFILGTIGGKYSRQISGCLARLVLLGNTFSPSSDDAIEFQKNNTSSVPLRNLAIVDSFVRELSSSVSIDIVPGDEDPCGIFLPQQPINLGLLNQSQQRRCVQSVTNPYFFQINETRFLGTSGRAVRDIMEYSRFEKDIDALQLTVDSRILCPTAPDTLPCYPFSDKDPFCVPSDPYLAPHVFFTGNSDEFSFKWWSNAKTKWWNSSSASGSSIPPNWDEEREKDILILTIPKFSEKPQLILYDVFQRVLQVIDFGSS